MGSPPPPTLPLSAITLTWFHCVLSMIHIIDVRKLVIKSTDLGMMTSIRKAGESSGHRQRAQWYRKTPIFAQPVVVTSIRFEALSLHTSASSSASRGLPQLNLAAARFPKRVCGASSLRVRVRLEFDGDFTGAMCASNNDARLERGKIASLLEYRYHITAGVQGSPRNVSIFERVLTRAASMY